MAREISQSKSVKVIQDVTFTSRAVRTTAIVPDGDSFRLEATAAITGGDVVENESLSVDLDGLTVQTILDELEAFTGSAPDLSALTVVDFIHSIIHERA